MCQVARHVRLQARQPGRHGGVHGPVHGRRWSTRSARTSRRRTRRSPSRCPARCTRSSGPAISFDDIVVVAGCGPIGLGMIAGAAAKFPQARRRARHGPATSSTWPLKTRRDRGDQHRRGGRGRQGQGDDRRLRLRRLPRGHRCTRPPSLQGLNMLRKLGRSSSTASSGATSPSTGHHQRRQGARRTRRPPRPELLARRHPADRVGPAPDGRDLHATSCRCPSSRRASTSWRAARSRPRSR